MSHMCIGTFINTALQFLCGQRDVPLRVSQVMKLLETAFASQKLVPVYRLQRDMQQRWTFTTYRSLKCFK
jgi:hypothetical protein